MLPNYGVHSNKPPHFSIPFVSDGPWGTLWELFSRGPTLSAKERKNYLRKKKRSPEPAFDPKDRCANAVPK